VAKSWLWPDRQIGKRESRELREEHNALVNHHETLREILQEFVEDVELAYGIHDGDGELTGEIDEDAMDWHDLAVTYGKAASFLKGGDAQ